MPALKDKLLFLVQEKVATGARNVPLALAINDKANQHAYPFILNSLFPVRLFSLQAKY